MVTVPPLDGVPTALMSRGPPVSLVRTESTAWLESSATLTASATAAEFPTELTTVTERAALSVPPLPSWMVTVQATVVPGGTVWGSKRTPPTLGLAAPPLQVTDWTARVSPASGAWTSLVRTARVWAPLPLRMV